MVLLMRARVQAHGVEEGHHRVVVGEQIGLVDAKLVIEDIEELALYPTDVTLAEDTGAKCPVDVLECGVIAVLKAEGGRSGMMSVGDMDRNEETHTLFARISAPRKTRSHAHCSRAIWRCGFARST